MGIRSVLARPFAASVARQTKKWSSQPVRCQKDVFHALIEAGKNTLFGRDHDFKAIKNYEDFKIRVPVRDYESFKPYITRVLEGKPDILWKGKPAYFAKTSEPSISPLLRIPCQIILMVPAMRCSVMFMKPGTHLFWMGG